MFAILKNKIKTTKLVTLPLWYDFISYWKYNISTHVMLLLNCSLSSWQGGMPDDAHKEMI